jgi:hypothetical protein
MRKGYFLNFLMAILSIAVVGCTQRDPNAWKKIADEYFEVNPKAMALMFKGIENMGIVDKESDRLGYMFHKPLLNPATLLELETKYGTPDRKQMREDPEGKAYHAWWWGPVVMGASSPEKTIERYGLDISWIRKQ